jgi:hypothetical protein
MPIGRRFDRRAYEGGWTAKDSLPALDELFAGDKAVLVLVELGEAGLGFFGVGLPGEILVERELGFAGVKAVVANVARLVSEGGGGLGG